MHSFSFATATRILFGENIIQKVSELEFVQGKKILLVGGRNLEKQQQLLKIFPKNSRISFYQIESEPTIGMIDIGVEQARQEGCGVVIGIGGGSVIDAAKAIAAMVPNQGELMNYLEVIGEGKPLINKPLPCIAIPTTAGTGAEVTKNSVIKSLEHNVKVSLRSDYMFPDVAVVDPVLTYSMSPALTASTGIDALTHLLETFVSKQANPFIDMICRDGLSRISRSLLKACKNGTDVSARRDLSMASMLGGMALANVKLGAVHGFAGPLGGMFPVPHGTVCASLVAAVIETNIEAIKEIGGDLSKFQELARILTGSDRAKAEDAVVWTENLAEELNIPALSEFGLSESVFPLLVQKAKAASSMKGNPIVLNDEQLTWILEKSL